MSAPFARMPAVVSEISPSYNLHDACFEDEPENPPHADALIPVTVSGYGMPVIPTEQQELVHHYLYNVLPIQYLLADPSISRFMFRLLQTNSVARDAACVLSALHLQHTRYNSRMLNIDFNFKRLESSLLCPNRPYTEGDAMAGLHIVSTFLFNGGRGPWDLYLDIASQYVTSVLHDPNFYGPEDVLKRCSDSTRFIIKTTMWFDVLASVTTQQVPRFLEVYRLLFGHAGGAYIDDPLSGAEEISMLPVMGCENHIVLAIAEISNLAVWKEGQRRRGCLSVPQLKKYLDAPGTPPAVHPPRPARTAPASTRTGTAPTWRRRTRRSRSGGSDNDIFRASARVYLHTVLSGDYPSCPEIMASVAETLECLHQVPTNMPSVSRGVVRSVVFGICISGCLTDDPRQRTFLLKMLETQQGESVGNVSEVRALMESVWARRENSQGRPRDLLLLV
ncbi:hypothetical protein A0H81_07619 [Grifola frondosa]|uniref:Uncharacterized protein n=1 Tax=Grifola frondosa TaxID=5627 RepID=A0A1C7M5U2_GRIFR|nr:hypothetical protein A0H81_07619 [Grifola frondosa]